ncbi:hypothetical protein DQ04_07381030 [Trypanosoma grayi]|uniref:hypothetical protein n=1 Tax=Trypanosoma grayi TaxID=71804 RepID=UPI0004F49CF4|nr:hypothetical protein DQ04_07381030 [Trypanosoma grayi]KEG08358.1 hypothetical protein DQ04_07381030 [Trypanosoma grayi]
MVVVRVALRLRFTKVPGVQGERVFRDTMTVTDPHDHGYQDIGAIVEKKLRFMDVPPCDFTVFHKDSKTGDTVVVDDAYLCELLEGLVEEATTTMTAAAAASPTGAAVALGTNGGFPRSANDDDDDDSIVEKAVSFDVEVGRERPTDNPLQAGGNKGGVVLPLTSEALEAHASDGVRVGIASLTCPPKYPNFFIRVVVIAIRFKAPKPNMSVCEIDFCDAEDAQQQITSVTFDAVVQKAVRDNLRSDRRQVVELRNIYLRVKNETDRRFQTNKHALLIRMDRGSRIEVVQVLPVPIALRSEQVVSVRENLLASGLVNLSDLAGFRDSHDTRMGPSIQNVHSAIGSSSSSSSGQSGARRTMLSFTSSISSGNMSVSGVVPSQMGEQVKRQQAQFLSKRVREEPLPWEPDTPQVTLKDVRLRDAIVEQQAVQEEVKKDRIRRRKEVNQACIICGINCEDESTLRLVEDLLKNSSRNMGRHTPTMAELRHALSDRRRTKDGKPRNRLVCSEHFVDLRTRTVHVVHCRCVHLCSGYQKGSELEDVVFCDLPMQMCELCGMPGASVSCYHPDCHENYHTVCALFSGGYVNFGKKDPYLPCPACPRHTQVVVKTSKDTPVVSCGRLDSSAWWEEDEVVFDSRVVEDTDLRDPDENDGV